MKTIFSLISLFLILVSCSTEKNDAGKIYSLEVLQQNTLEQYYFGEEKLATLNEYTQDKSAGTKFHSRILKISQCASEIDSCAGNVIYLLEDLKVELFKQSGEEIALNKPSSMFLKEYNKRDPSGLCTYDFTKVKHTGGSSVLNSENREKIVTSIRTYRKLLCELLEKSITVSDNRKPYFFKDPNIIDFKDQSDFNKQFDEGLKQSNVSPDDLEAIRRIYELLSKTDEQWESIIHDSDSWMDAITILLSLQSTILQTRSLALGVVHARIGCIADFGFTKILPVVYGPNAAQAGDTVELRVLMAAINGDKDPFITVSRGKVTKVENGIGYIKVVVPKSGEINVGGKISIMNQSGIPKTQDWSHRIQVMKNN